MYSRQLLYDESASDSYLLGCKGKGKSGVILHVDLVDEHIEFEHHPLADGETIGIGNTELEAVATPGHGGAHHAYLVTDHVDEPWFVLTGDALLVGDAGRRDLHAHGAKTVEDMARALYRSITERLLTLPDHLPLYPAHYSGSVCGRGLSGRTPAERT